MFENVENWVNEIMRSELEIKDEKEEHSFKTSMPKEPPSFRFISSVGTFCEKLDLL